MFKGVCGGGGGGGKYQKHTCRRDSSSQGVPGLIPAIHGPRPVFSKTGSRMSQP